MKPGCPKQDKTLSSNGTFDRRALLAGASAVAVGAVAFPLIKRLTGQRASVFVARHQRYSGPLARTIRDGLLATGFDPSWVRDKRVILKPNMVEPDRRSPQMTTHPAMVAAAAEVFLAWGADVAVGEAPAHVRDTDMALVESGIDSVIRSENLPFIDFNYAETTTVANRGGTSNLQELFFPTAVTAADLIVSMPKLKTHHWVGMTASLKNMYGTLPGQIYGWPKNVLHFAGIPQTVVDINASLPKTIAIVDGILCMEGDGPIMGTPKPMGLVAVSTNCTALDATLARILGFDPARVSYLELADGRLGPIADYRIEQKGEPWQGLVNPFAIVDTPHLQQMRADA